MNPQRNERVAIKLLGERLWIHHGGVYILRAGSGRQRVSSITAAEFMPTILQNHYVLAVHNVRESARFYVDVLGFSVVSEHEGWIFVKKDNCMIMLGECPDDMHPSKLGCHNYFAYLRVDDVDAYHAQVERAGVKSVGAVADKPWGMREFLIHTPDGHRLVIGQIIGGPAEV
jgi:uncharacterized glyoxalase superfamily protein PhnB